MSYALTLVEKPGYLHFVVTGENSADAVNRYMAEIVQACAARDVRRVLIEERLEGPRLSALEVFDLMWKGASELRGVFEAVAYVDVNREGYLMDFAQKVAVNREMPMRVFTSVADAEQWLSDEIPPPLTS